MTSLFKFRLGFEGGSFRLGAVRLLTQPLSLLITSDDNSNYLQSLFKGGAGGKVRKASMWSSHGTTAVKARLWGPRPWLDASLGHLIIV